MTVPHSGNGTDGADQEIAELRRKISNIGAVNLESLQDLQALESRYEDLAGQFHDLQSAKDALQTHHPEDQHRQQTSFLRNFRKNPLQLPINVPEGIRGWRSIHRDGQSDEDVLERGIEIVATPPGKQSLRLSLLSGGERALTAVTLLLAIFQYRPSPSVCSMKSTDRSTKRTLDDSSTSCTNSCRDQVCDRDPFQGNDDRRLHPLWDHHAGVGSLEASFGPL